MENLMIREDNSVGLIKFGMDLEEAENCIEIYKNKCNSTIAPLICEYDDDGKVISIHLIIDVLKEYFHCTFKGVDIFNTKASKLIEHFDYISHFDRNQEASLGYTYKFTDLGLSFWRGNVCTEDDIESEWFKNLSPSIQEDNKKFLFFETVTLNKVKK